MIICFQVISLRNLSALLESYVIHYGVVFEKWSMQRPTFSRLYYLSLQLYFMFFLYASLCAQTNHCMPRGRFFLTKARIGAISPNLCKQKLFRLSRLQEKIECVLHVKLNECKQTFFLVFKTENSDNTLKNGVNKSKKKDQKVYSH